MASTERARDVDGKFIAIHPQTRLAQRRSQSQREAVTRNFSVAEELFDQLLSITMVRSENAMDTIAAGSGEGAINFIAEKLIKKTYLLSRYNRCTRARQFYCTQENMDLLKQDQLPTITLRRSDQSSRTSFQKPVFKSRRLPKLMSRCRETNRVWVWIDGALRKKLLVLSDRNAAFDVFQRAKLQFADPYLISNYQIRRRASNQSQSERNAALTSSEDVNTSEDGDARNSDGTGRIGGSVFGNTGSRAETCPDDSRLDIAGTSAGRGARIGSFHQGDQFTMPSEESFIVSNCSPGSMSSDAERLSLQTSKLVRAALNDNMFFLICRSVDERDDCKLQLAAAAKVFLNELQSEGLGCEKMLLDALLYVIEERFGVSNLASHRDRLERVLVNVSVMKKIRHLLKKQPYESMTWNSLSNRLETANGERQ